MPGSTSWDEFRLVKAVADAHSLVGAAEILGVNHSTVFRRLGALEESLGTRLFERSRIGYEPTPAGEEMIMLAGRMSQEISDFERSVAGRDVKPAGDLRVTTNDTFLAYFLAPVLTSFSRAYPDIRIDLIVANSALNLSRRDADVALRATVDPPDTLVGRRIAPIVWSRYASADWLAAHPDVDEDSALWVGFGDALSTLRPARWLSQNVAVHRIRSRVDSLVGIARMVGADVGIGLLPCFIGDRTPGLVRIGHTLPPFGESIWLLTHPDIKNSARVRAFMDFAGAELARMKKMLQGE